MKQMSACFLLTRPAHSLCDFLSRYAALLSFDLVRLGSNNLPTGWRAAPSFESLPGFAIEAAQRSYSKRGQRGTDEAK